jgi:hypothetical protein
MEVVSESCRSAGRHNFILQSDVKVIWEDGRKYILTVAGIAVENAFEMQR